ncbi:succinate dehydrogenase cytochrome b subunit [Aureibacter tunicatorum]|uniref:Succinate dehydrogenase / fumarate reductase cytochrome b subunit n=1 Tax=Aureibacter tunicatorum TaxID=866807 RepID=A0AAE3XPN2_9BACT|nr:succinate dehydrogenase cytochrome b subunit [Aureibacter tunicatorum]MDR6239744.1 succinate dehydrogenase / fumarate reductase cytochrome b subunit [Aureibacter tunicatorum]BDD04220.1 succinate dehydrogenase [Aureibacter tunicatorum]
MSKVKQTFSVTLGRKIWMALTGLFLITFLVIHLLGNLQLFVNDGGQAFNLYSAALAANPLIKTVAYVLYFSIIAHALISLILTNQNKAARPVAYATVDAKANSKWSSRNMGILGTVILIFIVLHMAQFWYRAKISNDLPVTTIDGVEYKDLYTIVVAAFKQLWIVAVYVISMIFLGYHLNHGFQSAFQTLGLNHPKYTPIIKALGTIFSIVVPFGFAIMPIYVYLFV